MRLSFWIYFSTRQKGNKCSYSSGDQENVLNNRKLFFPSSKEKGEEYSNCGLWLLGVCWGRFGRKFFWRVWWRVLQLKNVISLKKARRIIEGESLLPKLLRGSTAKKKRGFRFYVPSFFFFINDCMNFQIH